MNWYKEYLKTQRFIVAINSEYSVEKIMEFGMPQGSVQAAFLYRAHASPVQNVIKEDLNLNGFLMTTHLGKPFNPNQKLWEHIR